MKLSLRPITLCATLALASCSSIASRQEVPRPSLDERVSSSQVHRVYVARASQMRGSLRPIRVFENEREIGAIGSDDFLCWERPAGRKIMRLVYEGRVTDSGHVENVVSVEGEPGGVSYFQVWLPRKTDDPRVAQEWGKPQTTLLSEEEGRKLISERDPARLR